MGGKSRKAKAYHTRQHLTQQRLKDGIESLNELFGSETSSDYFTSDMTQEQIVATDHLNSCVCESPPPQPLMQPDAALAMLLHSNSVYKSDDLCAVRSDLAPYDCAKLSCPQNADFLMDVAESLSAPDSRLISGSGEHLLLTDTQYADKVDLDGGKIRPYMCPSLHKRADYVTFIAQIMQGGMLVPGRESRALLTPFFVKKKNDKIRLVLDARGVNQCFRPPKKPRLGSCASLSELQIPEGERLYISTSDIKDCFYSMRAPEWLHPYFP